MSSTRVDNGLTKMEKKSTREGAWSTYINIYVAKFGKPSWNERISCGKKNKGQIKQFINSQNRQYICMYLQQLYKKEKKDCVIDKIYLTIIAPESRLRLKQ